MVNISINDIHALTCFWLVFTRWMLVIIQLPIFDNVSIPNIIKILFSLVLSYAFFPLVKGEVYKDMAYMGADSFWTLTIFYAVVSLLIGFLVKCLMDLFTASGSIITQQVGFGAVAYFDPQSASRVGPFERIIQWTMVVVIISSGALLPMFKGIFNSFFSIHVYDLGKMATSPEYFTTVFKGLFLSALLLASPLIFTNMLIMTVLGIVARTVPQMNVIMVSFVVNIGLGLLVFAASSSEFFKVAFQLYTEKLGNWFQFLL
ncbi:MAG: flagellar biosynthetic protein FliR [Bacteriovoracaceae bacterium]|nr:flagellar biosynthetic protein FliR [Bacteriovoracaceae bacterium]